MRVSAVGASSSQLYHARGFELKRHHTGLDYLNELPSHLGTIFLGVNPSRRTAFFWGDGGRFPREEPGYNTSNRYLADFKGVRSSYDLDTCTAEYYLTR